MRHVKVKTVFATHTHSNANLGKKSTIYIRYAKCVIDTLNDSLYLTKERCLTTVNGPIIVLFC